jgi:hypothetical protein
MSAGVGLQAWGVEPELERPVRLRECYGGLAEALAEAVRPAVADR